MTRTKYARLHQVASDGLTQQIVKRAEPLPPAMPRFLMCRFCRKPMRVGTGQIQYYHRMCRKAHQNRQRINLVSTRKSAIIPSKGVRGTTSGTRARVDSHDPTK